MKPANMESLKEKIVRPDFDAHLVPLLLYRGSNNRDALGRMSRLWNFAITMMESECLSFGQAVKLSRNPDYAHLCGPRKPLQTSSFYGLFGRLIDNPKVTSNIKGLTDYARMVEGSKFKLTKVSIYTNQTPRGDQRFAPWRIQGFSPEKEAERSAKRNQRSETQKLKLAVKAEERRLAHLAALKTKQPKELQFYPYLMHKPTEGDGAAELVWAVHEAVPEYLPHHIREDICQDLLVALLAGDIQRWELEENVREYSRRVMKMHPFKYGDLSLDDFIPGTTLKRVDALDSRVEHF